MGHERTSDVDVAVVGGGISGLTAARVLSRSGLRVRLFESKPECGGLIATERIGDWLLEAGPDTLLTHKPAALELVRDLGLEPQLVAPLARRPTYVLRRNALRTLPETSALGLPTDIATLVRAGAFSWRGKLRMAAEAVLPPAPPASDESIGSFVGRRFGREAVRFVAEPVLAGIHRGDAGRLSLRALFPVLANAERTHGSVCRAWRSAPRRPAAGSIMTLRRGLGELVSNLTGQLPPKVVTRNATVDGVFGGGPFVLQLRGRGLVSARAVILAAPAHASARLVDTLDPALAALCASIRHVGSVNVALGYRRDAVAHPLDGWGFVVPSQGRRSVRSASWVTSKWPGRAPGGHVLIRVSMADDSAVDDRAAIAQADGELRDLLGITADPVLTRVHRAPRAMPQLEVGHLDRMAAIDRQLAGSPGLFISAAGFRGVGLPDCIADASQVASRVVQFCRN